MKITKRQLRKIIRETTAGPPIGGDQAISLGGSYDRRPGPEADHETVSDAIADILFNEPGISGMELVKRMRPVAGSDKVFEILDELQEDDEVIFDVEEDAWYLSDRGDYYDYMKGFKS